jgi:hypothetical protein
VPFELNVSSLEDAEELQFWPRISGFNEPHSSGNFIWRVREFRGHRYVFRVGFPVLELLLSTKSWFFPRLIFRYSEKRKQSPCETIASEGRAACRAIHPLQTAKFALSRMRFLNRSFGPKLFIARPALSTGKNILLQVLSSPDPRNVGGYLSY